MKKSFLAIILSAAMLLCLLPTMALADNAASLILRYGTDGALAVTLPATDGSYTYGTANGTGTSVAQTAADAATLPDTGWNWAVQKAATTVDGTTYDYILTLNDFNADTTGWTSTGISGNCIESFFMNLYIVLHGTNTLATPDSRGTAIISETSGNKFLISGKGTLNASGCLGIAANGGLTISGGTINATGAVYALGSSNGSVTVTGGTVTATGGTLNGSNGIRSSGAIIISGGTVTAKSASGSGNKNAFSKAPTLSYIDGYLWRTGSSDDYTQSSAKAYAYAINQSFVNIKPIDYTMDFSQYGFVSWYSSFPNANLATTNASGDGWSWVAGEKQLTLSGLDFATTAGTAIKLPDGAKLVLQDGTANTVKSGDVSIGYSIGINGFGSLTICGNGTLNVTGGTANGTAGASFGISAGDALTINGGTVTAKATGATGTRSAFNKAPTLTGYTGGYQWRIGGSGAFTPSTVTAYTYDAGHTHVEIQPLPAADYTYNTPVAITQNGVTATVTYNPASPQTAGTNVAVTVTLTGTATAAGTHSVNLTSSKARLSGAEQTATVTAGQNLTATPVTKTFTFTVPAQAVDDLTLTHAFTAAPTPPSTPAITDPTTNKTVTVIVGSMATISVTAENAVEYQWYVNRGDGKGFVSISGATGASYTTSAVTVANEGYQYYCIVSGAAGATSATSPTFTLRVIEQPDIPATGDNNRPGLWIGLALFACAGLAGSIFVGRRKQRE